MEKKTDTFINFQLYTNFKMHRLPFSMTKFLFCFLSVVCITLGWNAKRFLSASLFNTAIAPFRFQALVYMQTRLISGFLLPPDVKLPIYLVYRKLRK